MRPLVRSIVQALEAGQSVQLVTVLSAGGSTPRGTGAMLAVFPEGPPRGTVGGGSVEYEAAGLARRLLETGENALEDFRFHQGEDAQGAAVCGGTVTLHFQYLPAGDGAVLALFRDLLDHAGSGGVWLVRRLEGAAVTHMALADRAGCRDLPALPAGLLADKAVYENGWLAVPAAQAGRLYIFGGGHVSQALVPAAAAVGFRPVVYDDRPEFADKALFPQAEAVLFGDFATLSEQVAVTAEDYVVVMTRSHQADYQVLARTLRSGARYIGCIGSRKKLALCREKLLAAGFTEAEYRHLHAPIGLAIGAETPAEIAVSVTAELIAVRAGSPGF